MKLLVTIVALLFVLGITTYHGQPNGFIHTDDGICYEQNRYEWFWIDNPIQNPWHIEVCK